MLRLLGEVRERFRRKPKPTVAHRPSREAQEALATVSSQTARTDRILAEWSEVQREVQG